MKRSSEESVPKVATGSLWVAERIRTMLRVRDEIKDRAGCPRSSGTSVRIVPIGPGEKPRIGPLALAIVLAHLAIAYPAWAESPAAATNDSAPASDARAVTANTEQGLQKPTDLRSLCQTIASAADQNGLPFEFFSRIIWQESRFNSGAIGPVTRGGQRAQGIAQFMPATASERSVRDPFDPFEALPKSAEFLRELNAQFGNLGLAAAAYNAGPQRVRDWLDGKRTLPPETQAYVQKVTGHSAQEWMLPKPIILAVAVPAEMSCMQGAGLMHKLQPLAAPSPPRHAWVAQLIGDSSETAAMSRFRQMQGKLRSALGSYVPSILRTSIKTSSAPIWVRVRVEFDTRQAAESLCAKLEAAREPCLVQRNVDDAIISRPPEDTRGGARISRLDLVTTPHSADSTILQRPESAINQST